MLIDATQSYMRNATIALTNTAYGDFVDLRSMSCVCLRMRLWSLVTLLTSSLAYPSDAGYGLTVRSCAEAFLTWERPRKSFIRSCSELNGLHIGSDAR